MLRFAFASLTRALFAFMIFHASIPAAIAMERHGSSARRREEKTMEATLGMRGLSIGLFATPDSVFEGSYNYTRLFSEEWVNTFGARYRGFIGNSFNGCLGIDYERKHVMDPREMTPEDVEPDGVVYLAGSIGNQWQWRAITFGIDWFEVRVPISRIQSATIDEDLKARSRPMPLGPMDVRVLGLFAGIAI
jgi:hypothetical protein